jgi:hypothetical protein
MPPPQEAGDDERQHVDLRNVHETYHIDDDAGVYGGVDAFGFEGQELRLLAGYYGEVGLG